MKIENQKFFIVYDFMIKDLKLSGYELLLYALIYSYTNNTNEKCFWGSQEYVARCLGTHRQRINVCLKKLVEKGLVKKSFLTIGNTKYPSYTSQNATATVKKVDSKLSQNMTRTVSKQFSKTSQNDSPICHETVHNNMIDNMNDNMNDIMIDNPFYCTVEI